MADAPHIDRSIKQSRQKWCDRHLQTAQGSIRTMESLDNMLIDIAGITDLQKPKYPRDKRV